MYEIIKNLKGKGANKNIKYLFILVAAGVLIVLKLIMSGNEQDYITGKIKRPEPEKMLKVLNWMSMMRMVISRQLLTHILSQERCQKRKRMSALIMHMKSL